MSDRVEPITIKIMDKEYVVGCPPEEREALSASARYVDKKMREIKSSGRGVASADRIAIMAALNIANELFQQQAEPGNDNQEAVKARINALSERIGLHLHD